MKTFHDKAKLFFWLTAIILIFHTYVDTAEAQGPSYDCGNVIAGSIEEMICFDKGLSALDRRLAEVYTIAIEKAVNEHPPILKPEQRGWIKGRCTSIASNLGRGIGPLKNDLNYSLTCSSICLDYGAHLPFYVWQMIKILQRVAKQI